MNVATAAEKQRWRLARLGLNNAELIDALRARDPVAARHLNDCLVPSIWRYVYFRVDRDPHLTEDIVAETVLALVSAASSEDAITINNPSAWLRTVALRRIQDHFRAVARVQHLIERAEQNTGCGQPDPAIEYDEALDRQQVRDAMERLPEHYRLALEWKYVDSLSVAKIAERLGTTEKGAEAVLFRARRDLRRHLQSEHTSPPTAESANAQANLQANQRAAGSVDTEPPHQSHGRSTASPENASREETSILFKLRLAQDH
ncbi:RNA polymerase sigma factor [Neorhodopirellula pilleata]|uniref:RNA polymerase sigma factor n=1 Tax=Neorhodopirellula pilleata TaxID=2714738 RepID=UPI001E59A88B|nr:sigma-70 family RNA polymerase sigma factor [Neorhodopirellula pilleata]